MNNKSDARAIIENALTERKAREAAQKAKEKIREAATGKGAKSIFADLPSKLSDAYPKDKKDRSKCELFICEGDSAGSSIKAVKNSEFQAVFPIRGKIINCLKAKPAEVFGNAEVSGIVKALGLTADEKTGKLIYDRKKLRYDKIIIATDADADGSDIALLLLTVFDFLCPELIMNGHIYRVYGALFKVIFPDNTYTLIQTDADLEKWKKKNGNKRYTLTRAKGLGELEEDETDEQLVNPATRNLKRIYVKDYDEFQKTLKIFKSDDKDDKLARQEYYEKFLDEREGKLQK